MYSKEQFSGDFIKAYGHLGAADFRFGQLTQRAKLYIDHGFSVYQNAASNPLGSLVVGRIVKKDGNGQRLNL